MYVGKGRMGGVVTECKGAEDACRDGRVAPGGHKLGCPGVGGSVVTKGEDMPVAN